MLLRAGIEGSLSEGVRCHGLRRARYRGQPKTLVQVKAIAGAINLVRIEQLVRQRQRGRPP
jgi:transposase